MQSELQSRRIRRQHQVDSNPIVPPQAAQTAPDPVALAPEGGNEQSSPSSKKMIIMLVVGVVVILAVVGGIYMLLSKQQLAPEPQVQQTTTAPGKPTIAQIKDALDLELDSINVEASEGDFKSVDQDLQAL